MFFFLEVDQIFKVIIDIDEARGRLEVTSLDIYCSENIYSVKCTVCRRTLMINTEVNNALLFYFY